MRHIRTVAPVGLPVTLEEAKAHPRITHDAEDAQVLFYLRSAVETVDGAQGWLNGRAILTQTWQLTVDAFPGSCLVLPLSPVQALTAGSPQSAATVITYLDEAGDEQTLDPATYRLVGAGDPLKRARVVLANGASWPATESREEAVTVQYVAGFGEPADVPHYLRMLIVMIAADFYERREKLTLQQLHENPSYRGLWEQSRVPVRL